MESKWVSVKNIKPGDMITIDYGLQPILKIVPQYYGNSLSGYYLFYDEKRYTYVQSFKDILVWYEEALPPIKACGWCHVHFLEKDVTLVTVRVDWNTGAAEKELHLCEACLHPYR